MEVPLQVVNPLALLYKAFKQGGGFARYLELAMSVNPPTHEESWSLILYSDEIVPGNALSNDNKRKVWGVYFSWMEFGMIVAVSFYALIQSCVERS